MMLDPSTPSTPSTPTGSPAPQPLFTGHDTLSTEVLAQLAAKGDQDAFAELYERHIDQLYRFVVTCMNGDRTGAEDVASDAWMRVMRSMSTYDSRGDGSFPKWLYTIARRLVMDQHRSGWRRKEVVTQDMLALDQPDPDLSPEVASENKETAKALTNALKHLSPGARQCVTLRFLHGLSVAETAEIMGRTEGAVKTTQFRALRKLKSVLPQISGYPLIFATDPATVPARRTA